MSVNLLDIIILLAIGQAFLLGILLITSPAFNKGWNSYLGMGVIVTGIIGLNILLSKWHLDDRYYLVDLLGDDVPWILLVYAPFFYYFLGAAGKLQQNSQVRFWLLVPFCIFLILNLIIDGDVDFSFYQLPGLSVWQEVVYTTEYFLALFYAFALAIASYFIIRGYAGKDKPWLWKVWGFTLGIIIYWILLDILEAVVELKSIDHLLWPGISIFIFWFAYQGLVLMKFRQSKTMKNTGFDKEANTAEDVHYRKFLQLMEEQKPYLRQNLNRSMIAQELGISTGYLSTIINSHSGESLSELITRYRIEHAKELLMDSSNDRFSLEAIGADSGFKSKSVFYAAFKSATGTTPRNFKKGNEKSRIQ